VRSEDKMVWRVFFWLGGGDGRTCQTGPTGLTGFVRGEDFLTIVADSEGKMRNFASSEVARVIAAPSVNIS
ncbi:MAG: hypothetical protein K2M57_04265, partial [Paramuribaculum sp.]|nr:hypothetical protein [Paramuribaculum sp.]